MMQQEFKMNSEKKAYCKPEMDIVDMVYEPNVLQACSGVCDDVIDTDVDDTVDP
jgi:hypothetical protein